MDSNAKKLLDQIGFLLNEAKEKEGIKYMLVACHKNDGAVFYNGKPKEIGEVLADNAFKNHVTATTINYAFQLYVEMMEKTLIKLKEKEAEKCQEKSKL